MSTILVLGASGFVGSHLTKALLSEAHAVRCMSRDPSRLQELATAGCEIVQGDIADPASMQRALDSVQAVYIAIHTISPQAASTPNQRFMEVELKGLHNVITACRAHGVDRVVYVTSLGTAADASSEWLRGRWEAQQLLLTSGLDVTVFRPGMIVGAGGNGFEMLASQAKKPVAVFLGGQQKMRTISIDDLTSYLVGVLDDSRTYGQVYDVGNDDVLTNGQMIDAGADILGRRHPLKIQIPLPLVRTLAPIIERAGKMPKGSFRGFLDSLAANMTGDPTPIRTIQPRVLLSYRQAAQRALVTE